MALVILFVSVIVFVAADYAVREFIRKAQERASQQERAQALAVNLKLDFSRESKTLKRVEVKDPVARILCVDDEDVILDSFRKILVLDGYNVDTVQTGQEALSLIRTHHYDFVFTDLKMPAMDGMDVVKSVKHVRPDIDVVVITGFATVETAVECMKHGAMDYVQKPFTEDELRAFVKKALIKRQDRLQRLLKPQVRVSHPAQTEGPKGEFRIPGGVFISRGHCWANMAQDGSVKVGLDDFAKKLIGPIDDLELPTVGASVKAGQLLFAARQKNRRVQFQAPVSGKVVKVNPRLQEDVDALDLTPYDKNWVCVIDSEKLEAEVPALKIGGAAADLFREDLDRFRSVMKGMNRPDADGDLSIGELAKLDDGQWDTVCKEFFARA